MACILRNRMTTGQKLTGSALEESIRVVCSSFYSLTFELFRLQVLLHFLLVFKLITMMYCKNDNTSSRAVLSGGEGGGGGSRPSPRGKLDSHEPFSGLITKVQLISLTIILLMFKLRLVKISKENCKTITISINHDFFIKCQRVHLNS